MNTFFLIARFVVPIIFFLSVILCIASIANLVQCTNHGGTPDKKFFIVSVVLFAVSGILSCMLW